MGHSSLRTILLAGSLALPALAHANVGIGAAPFIGLSIATVPALLGVIPLEALILRFALRLGFGRLVWLSLFANLLSTVVGALVGIALTFFVDVLFRSGQGPLAFIVGLALMYVATAAIEYRFLGPRLTPLPRPKVLRAVCAANAVSYALLLGWTYFLFVHNDPTVHRARVHEVLNVGRLATEDAGTQFRATGRFAPRRQEKPTLHTRSVTTQENGRITAVIDYPRVPELDGKTVAWEPEIREGRIDKWRCYVPEAPLRFFPPGCRFRSAPEAAAAP